MAKKPRFTKGVPEAVFQKELKAYLDRKEANPGTNVSAKFSYKGTSYTFERGKGPFNSGYQIKTSAGQAAKEMARTEQRQNIKLSEGEKMFMRDKYAAAAERNLQENRTGNDKLEVDHVEPRSKGGLHHPYNVRLMKRGNNGSKGNKQGGFGIFESLLPLDQELERGAIFRSGGNALDVPDVIYGALNTAAARGGPVVDTAVDAFYGAVDEPVRQATGNGVFEQIPNGSAKERKAKNGKVNGAMKKNNGHNGNGNGHAITNEVLYAAKKLSNGQLPYNGD